VSLPTMHGVGRLTADAELRFSASGVAVATVPLAFNARRYNQAAGRWEDGDVLFIRGTIFREPAENAVETYRRGDEVVVSGRLKTEQWQDRQTGENRSRIALLIDAIGPSTRYATAAISKAERRESAPPPGDAWNDAPAPTGFTDEPPF
jgi:single-strand DNA-binding protein